MKSMLLTCVLLWFGFASMTACSDEKKDILRVISEFFAAMETRDIESTRQILIPGGKFYSYAKGSTEYELMTTEEYLQELSADNSPRLQERLIRPDIKISGRIAAIWSGYQFFVDGNFSHCGVDLFDLIRTAEGWRIVGGAYTTETGVTCEEDLAEFGPWSDGQHVIE